LLYLYSFSPVFTFPVPHIQHYLFIFICHFLRFFLHSFLCRPLFFLSSVLFLLCHFTPWFIFLSCLFLLPSPSPFTSSFFYFHCHFFPLTLHSLSFLSAQDYTAVMQGVRSHSVRAEQYSNLWEQT
jgi:hypothetical protein